MRICVDLYPKIGKLAKQKKTQLPANLLHILKFEKTDTWFYPVFRIRIRSDPKLLISDPDPAPDPDPPLFHTQLKNMF